jgi:hypothetical protein
MTITFGASRLEAQVSITIGTYEPEAPAKGTLLDLNSGTKGGGLLLTNVELSDLTEIPNSFPGMSEIYDLVEGIEKDSILTDAKEKFKGAVVYNSDDSIGNGEGIYIWSGTEWNYYINGKIDYAPLPVKTTIHMPTSTSQPLDSLIGKLGDLEISYELTGSTISPTIKNTGNTPINVTYNVYRHEDSARYTYNNSISIGQSVSVSIFNNVTNSVGLYCKSWIYNHETQEELEFETLQVTTDRMIVKYISNINAP